MSFPDFQLPSISHDDLDESDYRPLGHGYSDDQVDGGQPVRDCVEGLLEQGRSSEGLELMRVVREGDSDDVWEFLRRCSEDVWPVVFPYYCRMVD